MPALAMGKAWLRIVEWFEIERGDGLEMLLEALGQ